MEIASLYLSVVSFLPYACISERLDARIALRSAKRVKAGLRDSGLFNFVNRNIILNTV